MANKTFYIPDADQPLWDAVERVAGKQKTSVYQVVRSALDRQLPIMAAEPAPDERWAAIAADEPAVA